MILTLKTNRPGTVAQRYRCLPSLLHIPGFDLSIANKQIVAKLLGSSWSWGGG